MLNTAITIGPIVLCLGVLVAIACIVIFHREPGLKTGTPLLRFVVLAFVVGIVSFVAGTALGIEAFCSSESSGNLCGLGGVFGVGPFLSGISVGGYACLWLKGTRRAA
jgi:hypothetical protein